MATVAPVSPVTPAPPPAQHRPPPPSGSITLRGVAWATYCQLRDAEANDHLRMSYLDGELTIMAPMLRHERFTTSLGHIVRAVAAASGLKFQTIGATTLRRPAGEAIGAGKEADVAFYLGPDELRMRGRWEIDLSIDPPPSLAIEVDHTGDSTEALATYARLGVPEVWRFVVASQTLLIHRLDGGAYRQADRSVALPRLTSALVLTALDRFGELDLDESTWLDWLREWARGLPEA